jgi:hypothetical protein
MWGYSLFVFIPASVSILILSIFAFLCHWQEYAIFTIM